MNALCSTDASWCEAAAAEFTRSTGIRVNQAHKGTGEIAAQLRAAAANPKTDIWWGGTGAPFLQAAEQGLLLDAYRPAYINDLHEWAVRQYAMSGNRVGGFYTSAIGFGYNSPRGQAIGAQAGSLQGPANKTFKPDPRISSMDGVRLIKYDFEKYGKAAERKRLTDRWTREVESLPR